MTTRRLEKSFCLKTDLAVGFGGEALPQVKRVLLTQAAAGRAINDSFSEFVTLKNTMGVEVNCTKGTGKRSQSNLDTGTSL